MLEESLEKPVLAEVEEKIDEEAARIKAEALDDRPGRVSELELYCDELAQRGIPGEIVYGALEAVLTEPFRVKKEKLDSKIKPVPYEKEVEEFHVNGAVATGWLSSVAMSTYAGYVGAGVKGAAAFGFVGLFFVGILGAMGGYVVGKVVADIRNWTLGIREDRNRDRSYEIGGLKGKIRKINDSVESREFERIISACDDLGIRIDYGAFVEEAVSSYHGSLRTERKGKESRIEELGESRSKSELLVNEYLSNGHSIEELAREYEDRTGSELSESLVDGKFYEVLKASVEAVEERNRELREAKTEAELMVDRYVADGYAKGDLEAVYLEQTGKPLAEVEYDSGYLDCLRGCIDAVKEREQGRISKVVRAELFGG